MVPAAMPKTSISRNKNIKTRKLILSIKGIGNQIFCEFSEKKKERISNVHMTRSQNSFMFSTEKRSISRESSHSRLQEWKTVNLRNEILSREK